MSAYDDMNRRSWIKSLFASAIVAPLAAMAHKIGFRGSESEAWAEAAHETMVRNWKEDETANDIVIQCGRFRINAGRD